MKSEGRAFGVVVALLVGTVATYAQEVPEPGEVVPQPTAVAPGPTPPRASSGLEAESLPGELTEDIDQAPDFGSGRHRSRKRTS